MKTADPRVTNRGIEKNANILRVLAPAVAQDQDDRMRQIIREELQANQVHSPHQPKQPSFKAKTAFSLALIGGFSDQLQRIKLASLINSVVPKPTTSSVVQSSIPKNTMSVSKPSYSQVNPASTPGPAQTTQPVLSPPSVRG